MEYSHHERHFISRTIIVRKDIRITPRISIPPSKRETSCYTNKLVNKTPATTSTIHIRLLALRETHCAQASEEKILISRWVLRIPLSNSAAVRVICALIVSLV